MKKESSTNLQKYLDQKNLDSSSFEIPEISLAQLILEQFTVNKETYKILLDIMYGDEGEGNGISTIGKFKDSTGKWIDAIIYERDNHVYMREITDFIDKFKKVIS